MFVPSSYTRQLDTPRLVRIALTIAAKVCKMNFQVSFFFIAYHLPFTDLPFTIFPSTPITPSFPSTPITPSSPPPELPSLEGRLGSLEQPLNVAVAPQRGANPHSRRRRAGGEASSLRVPPAGWSPASSLQLPHPPVPCGWGQD